MTLSCPRIIWLLADILGCKKTWRIPFLEAKNLPEVFAEKVVEVQLVERPMGHCGYTIPIAVSAHQAVSYPLSAYSKVHVNVSNVNVSNVYGEKTIKCLRCLGFKTSMSGKTDRVMHSAMLVKTENGKKYLIHKGKKFGSWYSRTIIEKPNDTMYNKGYRNVGSPIKPKKLRSIKEYFKASGNGYDFEHDNCHDGAERMIKLANKP